MPRISETIARLSAIRAPLGNTIAGSARLRELTDFGSNPGALKAWTHVPEGLPENAALVVVLHGCTQNAADYDRAAGWSTLADERGFAVLCPEQQGANNANRCFNWFVEGDIRRGAGEPLSIRQMVAAMVDIYGLDPARVFVTGLSAGGAMTAVMLATYPDIFAGGAVIAGLPYGTATTMPAAFERMRGSGAPSAKALGSLVRGASEHDGPWPTLSVWHGDSDRTVDAANAALLIDQWRGVHGVPAKPTQVDRIDGHPRQTWHDAHGRAVIEDYRIAGMGHGTPLDPASGAGGGTAAPYMLDVGIASTRRIAEFWGLGEIASARAASAQRTAPPKPELPAIRHPARARTAAPAGPPAAHGVQNVIEDALRAAGLMR